MMGRRLFFCALGIVVLLLPYIIRDDYYMHLFILAGIYSVLCMGWALILRAGQFSLGQAAFLAIGAYTLSLLGLKLGLSPWLGVLAAGMVSAIIAALLGWVVLRIRGLYFAVITLAFNGAVQLVPANVEGFGGWTGLAPVPSFALGDMEFISKTSWYYLVLVLVIFCGLVCWRLEHSKLGRYFKATTNESLAESIGINAVGYRMLAFVVACFFAGLAGGILASYMTYVAPGDFSVFKSMQVQIQSTVGGTSALLAGPVAGATMMIVLGEILRAYTKGLEPLLYGLVLLVVIFFLPDGLISLPGIFRKKAGTKQKAGSKNR
jgi:branched-chain amino acid transport system permease protein